MKHTKLQAGFTLVELSIVLVIIGLIVSSVLVGQDLVRQAELRSTVTQYEQFQAAVKTFNTKYNALPGDIQGATLYGWTGDGGDSLNDAASTPNAGSDDLLEPIADGHGVDDIAADNLFFWSHLGAGGAGLISGTYTPAQLATDGSNIAAALPEADAGNYWAVHSENGFNYYVIGAVAPGTAGEFDTDRTMVPVDAQSIDTKIDDARPGRGIVVARDQYDNDTDAAVEADNTAPDDADNSCTYADTSGSATTITDARYNVAETTAYCSLRLRF